MERDWAPGDYFQLDDSGEGNCGVIRTIENGIAECYPFDSAPCKIPVNDLRRLTGSNLMWAKRSFRATVREISTPIVFE